MARVPGQALETLPAEHVGDPAHAALDVEGLAVGGGDAGRLLAAVLERVEAEVGDVGGLGVVPDPEEPALVVELVVELERRRRRQLDMSRKARPPRVARSGPGPGPPDVSSPAAIDEASPPATRPIHRQGTPELRHERVEAPLRLGAAPRPPRATGPRRTARRAAARPPRPRRDRSARRATAARASAALGQRHRQAALGAVVGRAHAGPRRRQPGRPPAPAAPRSRSSGASGPPSVWCIAQGTREPPRLTRLRAERGRRGPPAP